MKTNTLLNNLEAASFGNRSFTQTIIKVATANNQLQDVADLIVDISCSAAFDKALLSSTAGKLTRAVARKLGLTDQMPKSKGLVSSGFDLINLFDEHVKPAKHDIITGRLGEGSVDAIWYLDAKTLEAYEYGASLAKEKTTLDPRVRHQGWTGPVLTVDGNSYDITRQARRFGMLGNYAYNEATRPFYDALNRLGETEWLINDGMYAFLNNLDNPIAPKQVSDEARKAAMAELNGVKRTARFIEEKRFEEYHKWAEEHAEFIRDAEKFAGSKAAEKASEWEREKGETYSDVIRAWSIGIDFKRTMSLASDYNGSTLNFTYNCDTRGRVYAMAPYLHPQGSDVAKSLLLLANPKPLQLDNLLIHLANCAGNDKGSFSERKQWTKDNLHLIAMVGEDPVGNAELLGPNHLDVLGEKKTKLQFVAACLEWHNIKQQRARGETPTCRIAIGLDATCSGVQLLSAIGRDETAAEHVNLTKTKDGRVGDLYQYIWDTGVAPELPKHIGKSATLDAFIEAAPAGAKLGRKTGKRPTMTFSYSAGPACMGTQVFEDRRDHGCDIAAALTSSDSSILGKIIYEACKKRLKASGELMEWMQAGIKHITTPVVSWTLPDGFLAFQHKAKCTTTKVAKSVCGVDVCVNVKTYTDKPDKMEHRKAIAPDVTHSLDAYLLRQMAVKLPRDANLHFIHDQFGTDSCYVDGMHSLAKDVYLEVCDRDKVEDMMEEAFGVHRDLPQAGSWNPDDIYSSDFIIC